MRTLIMCSGENKRWVENLPPAGISPYKQLAPVRGVPLIERTLKQVREWCENVYIVSPYREFAEFAPSIIPANHTLLPNTILSTQDLWEGRIIILLGDVYFSSQAITAIYKSREFCQFFGRCGDNPVTQKRWGELYGVVFDAWGKSRFAEALVTALSKEWYYQGQVISPRLWETYRAFKGLESHDSLWERFNPSEFLRIEDFTDDWDTYEEYQHYLSIIRHIRE